MDVEQVRAVQPAFSHNWDIAFPPFTAGPGENFANLDNELANSGGAPAPFNYNGENNFFPATSCVWPLYDLGSKGIKAGNMNIPVPTDLNPLTISITFYDHQSRILENWFKSWVKWCTGNGRGNRPLEECVKWVEIYELDIHKNVVGTYSYWVWPNGAFPVNLDSQGHVLLFTQSLSIVGDLQDIS